LIEKAISGLVNVQYYNAPIVWQCVVTLVEDNGSPSVMDILEPTRQGDEYGLAHPPFWTWIINLKYILLASDGDLGRTEWLGCPKRNSSHLNP
jgi:hypothetical protein